MRRNGDRDGRVDARQLLDRNRVRDRVPTGAAVPVLDRDPHQTELGHLTDQIGREAALAVELLGEGGDALPRERPHRVADQLVLGREVESMAQSGS